MPLPLHLGISQGLSDRIFIPISKLGQASSFDLLSTALWSRCDESFFFFSFSLFLYDSRKARRHNNFGNQASSFSAWHDACLRNANGQATESLNLCNPPLFFSSSLSVSIFIPIRLLFSFLFFLSLFVLEIKCRSSS